MSMFLVSKFFVVKHTSPMKFVKVDAKIRPVVQFRKSALASGGPPNLYRRFASGHYILEALPSARPPALPFQL